MTKETTRYSLQMRPVELSNQSEYGVLGDGDCRPSRMDRARQSVRAHASGCRFLSGSARC